MNRPSSDNNSTDILLPENEGINYQTGGFENANVEDIQQNLVHSSTPPQEYYGQPPKLDSSAPPPYEDCRMYYGKLPTYEETHTETGLEDAFAPILQIPAQTSEEYVIEETWSRPNMCTIILNILIQYILLFTVSFVIIFLPILINRMIGPSSDEDTYDDQEMDEDILKTS